MYIKHTHIYIYLYEGHLKSSKPHPEGRAIN